MFFFYSFWRILIFKSILIIFLQKETVANYSIFVPQAFHKDVEENIVFQVTKTSYSVTILGFADLQSFENKSNQFCKHVNLNASKITVPVQLNSSLFSDRALLVFNISDCKDGTCQHTFPIRNTTVKILPIRPIIFIETDKPAYKPGDVIRFRCLVLNEITLKPENSTLNIDEIYIENLKEQRLIQWLNLDWLTAFKGLKFQLSKDPSFGQWKIICRCGGKIHIQQITILKYSLAKFTASIIAPDTVLITTKYYHYKICAQYSTKRPMKASISTKFCLDSKNHLPKICIDRESRLNGIEKCTLIDVNVVPIFSNSTLFNRYSIYAITIEARIVEIGTGEIVSTTKALGTLKYTIMRLKINSLSSAKYGLPFYAEVIATHHNGLPFVGANITCNIFEEGKKVSLTQQTKEDGRLFLHYPPTNVSSRHIVCSSIVQSVSKKFEIFLLPDKKPILNRQPIIKEDSSSASIYVNVMNNNSAQIEFLIVPINPKISNICSGVLNVTIQATLIPENEIISAQVLSRGVVSPLKILNSTNWKNAFLKKKIVTKVMTFFFTSQQFIDSHIIIHMLINNNTIIADTLKTGIFHRCLFQNKIKFQLPSMEQKPGNQIFVNLNNNVGGEKCALRISDVNLKSLGKSGSVEEVQIIENFISLNYETKSLTEETILYIKERCPLASISSIYFSISDIFMLSHFIKSGLQVISSLPIFNNCPLNNRVVYEMANKHNDIDTENGIKIVSSDLKIRDFFPETWVFDFIDSPNESMNFTTPDTMTTWESSFYCVSKSGLEISPLSQMTTFSSFYIQMTIPYSIFRAETARLPVNIFNYLATCVEAQIKIEQSPAFRIKSQYSARLCICPNEQKTINFKIEALLLGRHDVLVIAKAQSSKICHQLNSRYVDYSVSDAVRRSILVEAEGFPEESVIGDLICVNDEEKVLSLEAALPDNLVEGSERGYIMWTPDIIGPSISNLGHLVRQPRGCGEQNMITLVPSIYVLDYFSAMTINQADIIEKAKKYIKNGYNRELNYRHKDGSFSAFGENDLSGSSWLTAFVVKSFIQAQRYINVEQSILTSALKFLMKQQDSSGCFGEPGKVIHRDMKGIVGNDNATLTAFILDAFLETNSLLLPKRDVIILIALNCIAINTPNVMTNLPVGSIALRAYALSRMTYQTNLTRKYLDALIETVKTIDGMLYWQPESKIPKDRRRWWVHASSGEIETSAYALIALMNKQNIMDSLKTVRWLTKSQNGHGGWVSTQDTVVGLHSLSTFAVKSSINKGNNITFNIKANGVERREIIDESKQSLTWKIPVSVPNRVTFKIKGQGCVITKVISLFNVAKAVRSVPNFEIEVNQSKTKENKTTLRGCTKFTKGGNESNMVVMEMSMPSGWTYVSQSLDNIRNSGLREGGLKRIDEVEGKLKFYFDSFQLGDQKCVTVEVEQRVVVEDSKNVTTLVYDYYEPEIAAEIDYKMESTATSDLNSVEIENDHTDGICIASTSEIYVADRIQMLQEVCKNKSIVIHAQKLNITNSWNFKELTSEVLLEWEDLLVIDLKNKPQTTCINKVKDFDQILIVIPVKAELVGKPIKLHKSFTIFPLERSMKLFHPIQGTMCRKQLIIFNKLASLETLSGSSSKMTQPLSSPFCSEQIPAALAKNRLCHKTPSLIASYQAQTKNWHLKSIFSAENQYKGVTIEMDPLCSCSLATPSTTAEVKPLIILSNSEEKLTLQENENSTLFVDHSFLITYLDSYNTFCG